MTTQIELEKQKELQESLEKSNERKRTMSTTSQKYNSYNWCLLAVELTNDNGPTGNFIEVTKCDIRDYGGNVHASGTPTEIIKRQKNFRIQTQIVATKTSGVIVAGADNIATYSVAD